MSTTCLTLLPNPHPKTLVHNNCAGPFGEADDSVMGTCCTPDAKFTDGIADARQWKLKDFSCNSEKRCLCEWPGKLSVW